MRLPGSSGNSEATRSLRGSKRCALTARLAEHLVREAAAAADVSPRTVYRWLSQG